MATREMIRMRDLNIENNERKRLSTKEKNDILIAQIYRIIEYMAKEQNKAILEEKQSKAEIETARNKEIINNSVKRRVAVGAIGGKKKNKKN